MSAFGRVELLAASAGVIGLILFLFSSDPSSPPMVATPLKSSSKAPEKEGFRKPAQRADAKRDEGSCAAFCTAGESCAKASRS